MDLKAEAKRQLDIIKKNCSELISEQELLEKLERSLKENRPLIVKAGFDPTAPDIHLGHCVLLRKLRAFQDLGHRVCFIVGDFTAAIGDPTGKSELRPALSKEEIMTNAKTYTEQAFKILDRQKTDVVFNSEWFDEMSLRDIAQLMRNHTVARMLERDDFEKRMKENKSISMLEFLYPLLQGYDSVKIKSDIELGGNDQKFNLLVGRHMQSVFGQENQALMTLPLLVGLDGTQKMSKSLNNYIGVSEASSEIFGKIMSISDELMYHYYELFTDCAPAEVKEMHPKDAKQKLGCEIVRMFYTHKEAEAAKERFNEIFSKRSLENQDFDEYTLTGGREDIISVIVGSGKLQSRNEVRRMLKQGAVQFDGQKITDEKHVLSSCGVLKIGKKLFLKIKE